MGDSRAVLGRCSTPARQTVSAVELSSDQQGASESMKKQMKQLKRSKMFHQQVFKNNHPVPFVVEVGLALSMCPLIFFHLYRSC